MWGSNLICGDNEINSRPRFAFRKRFSISHWKLNSITAHNYAELSFLIACTEIHKFDITCLSETYLNKNLKKTGYNVFCFDHTSYYDRRGIYVYYKDTLPSKISNAKNLPFYRNV